MAPKKARKAYRKTVRGKTRWNISSLTVLPKKDLLAYIRHMKKSQRHKIPEYETDIKKAYTNIYNGVRDDKDRQFDKGIKSLSSISTKTRRKYPMKSAHLYMSWTYIKSLKMKLDKKRRGK